MPTGLRREAEQPDGRVGKDRKAKMGALLAFSGIA
jgi:hypothetical protein